jgi:hypothetical protein
MACGGSGGGGGDSNTSDENEAVSDSDTSDENEAVSDFFEAPIVVERYTGGDTGSELYQATLVAPAAGDFNCDGFKDVLVTYPGYASADITITPHTEVPIKIYLNNQSGGFSDGTVAVISGPIPTTHFTRDIAVADYNGDGCDDAYLGNHGLETGDFAFYGEPDVLLLSNGTNKLEDQSGNITFTTPSLGTPYDGGRFTHGVEVGDFDGDNDVDLIVNIGTGEGTTILENDGTGVFAEYANMAKDALTLPFLPTNFYNVGGLWSNFIDANNDGDMDYVVYANSQNPDTGEPDHAVYLNNGLNDYNALARIPLPAISLPGPPEQGIVTDIDSDGDDDLVIGNTSMDFTNHTIQVYINDGSGNFTDETANRFPPIDWTENFSPTIYMIDLSGDGVEDILLNIGDASDAETRVYINVSGVYTLVSTGLTDLSNIVLSDFDADGDIDVFGTLATGGPEVIYIEAKKPLSIQ